MKKLDAKLLSLIHCLDSESKSNTKGKCMKRILWMVLIGCSVCLQSLQAASFDCAKAGTKVEHMICDNPEISKLDEELNTAYKAAMQDKQQADSIKKVQKHWLIERNSCAEVICVKKAYEERLTTFHSDDDKETMGDSIGRYKMIRDTIDVPHSDGIYTQEKHAEVCTAFLENLEASLSFPPMACDVKFKSEYTNFKTPEWHDVNVWENRDIELQIGTSPENEMDKKRQLLNLMGSIKNGMLTYRTAVFDIDNDGVPDQVLARIHGKCDSEKKYASSPYWRNYLTYDAASRKLDLGRAKFYGGYWDTASLFSYKGKTYYASFGGSTTEPYFSKNDRATKWYIRLYRPIPMSQGIKQPVALGCVYLYLPPKNNGGY